MSHSAPSTDGLRPSLAELIGLRERVRGWPPATRGAVGIGPVLAPLRGRGMEYAESRPYTPGDDARHIDWRLTARSGKPHTKLFQAERERVAVLVADTAPELYFGTRVRFKSVQAARIGAILTWAAQRRGDRVGALRGTDGEPPIRPQSGQRGVLRVLDALVRWYAQPPTDDRGLASALDTAALALPTGACVTVLAVASSLVGVPDGRLAMLAQRHDLRAVLLADPLELDPPRERLPFAIEQTRIEPDFAAASTRIRWRQAFAGLRDAQAQRLQALGAHACLLRNDADDDALMAALLDPRRVAA
ncbi:MAG: DUF58 domain-containing protein [Proteobacteria bacterium]|nr:DUF58 domain-containing protein [Pseudomonadota bacterium]